MFRTILVPLDGSSFAEHALPCTLTIARRAGAAVRLVSVVTPLAEAYVEGLYFSTADLQTQMTTQQQNYLDGVAARLREHAELTVTTEVLHGEVAASVNRLIDKGGIDLAVMATHGRGAGPLLAGQRGRRDDPPRHHPAAAGAAGGGGGRPVARAGAGPRRLLAGRHAAGGADPGAGRQPGGADARRLRDAHAGHPPRRAGQRHPRRAGDGARGQASARPGAAASDQAAADANRYLEGVAQKVRERGLQARTEVVVEDQPASAILHEAERERAGLIAIATHARTGLSRMLLGSVADKVIRGAHVPVLVYHPRQG